VAAVTAMIRIATAMLLRCGLWSRRLRRWAWRLGLGARGLRLRTCRLCLRLHLRAGGLCL